MEKRIKMITHTTKGISASIIFVVLLMSMFATSVAFASSGGSSGGSSSGSSGSSSSGSGSSGSSGSSSGSAKYTSAGYIFEKNSDGSYTKVGSTNPSSSYYSGSSSSGGSSGSSGSNSSYYYATMPSPDNGHVGAYKAYAQAKKDGVPVTSKFVGGMAGAPVSGIQTVTIGAFSENSSVRIVANSFGGYDKIVTYYPSSSGSGSNGGSPSGCSGSNCGTQKPPTSYTDGSQGGDYPTSSDTPICKSSGKGSRSCTYTKKPAPTYPNTYRSRGYAANVQPSVAPIVDITATPSIVRLGGSSRISWDGGQADKCSVAGPNLTAATVRGSQVVENLQGQSTYTLTCSKGTASAKDSARVDIVPLWREF